MLFSLVSLFISALPSVCCVVCVSLSLLPLFDAAGKYDLPRDYHHDSWCFMMTGTGRRERKACDQLSLFSKLNAFECLPFHPNMMCACMPMWFHSLASRIPSLMLRVFSSSHVSHLIFPCSLLMWCVVMVMIIMIPYAVFRSQNRRRREKRVCSLLLSPGCEMPICMNRLKCS